MFYPYQQHISIFLTKQKDNVAYYNLFGWCIVASIKSSGKKSDICENMVLSKTFGSIGRIQTGLQFSFKTFRSFFM